MGGALSPALTFGGPLIGVVRDARCLFCSEEVWDKAWELHEMAPNRWEVICNECAEVTEIGSGK